VSASERGEAFDYAVVFAEADAALYEAKRLGRDRVCGGELLPLAG
jgi:PleD family two-component response regulator